MQKCDLDEGKERAKGCQQYLLVFRLPRRSCMVRGWRSSVSLSRSMSMRGDCRIPTQMRGEDLKAD